jgi:hypothetical protein
MIDDLTAAKVVDTLKDLEDVHGSRFSPAGGLISTILHGGRYYPA